MNWLCGHVGTVTDPKIKLISRQSRQPLSTVIASWAVFLEVSASASQRGWLENFGPLELSASLDISQEEAEAIFVCFVARGLISTQGQILNWDKRQHGNGAERMRKKRHMSELVRTSAHSCELVHESATTGQDSTVQIEKDKAKSENIPETIAQPQKLPLVVFPPKADFEEWYALYPRKVGKGQARRAFATARKKAEQEILISGLRVFLKNLPSDPKFIPHPSTWLNGERWTDDHRGAKVRTLTQKILSSNVPG